MIPDEMIPVPEDLQERLGDAISAAILSEQGPDALTAGPAPARTRRTPRWLWGAVPAVALAALGCVFFTSRPKEALSPEAIEAYAQVELAFDSFSEALQMGYDSFSTPTQFTQP